MAPRKKRSDPIGRAIGDLDEQIASLQRQLREASTGSPSGSPATARISRLIKGVIAPSQRTTETTRRTRQDLFDVHAEPLKELEAEPIAFARKTDSDLFTQTSGMTAAEAGAADVLETAQVVPPQDKLAHYLGAGSIKSYKPLKHVRRQTRNRFFMWIGLSCLALWIIWFVVR